MKIHFYRRVKVIYIIKEIMKNTVSLKKNRDFLKLYRTGKFYVGKLMVIYYKQNTTDSNKLGISSVRNFGNSISRNRIRRLIKENYRLMEENIKSGWDIVFNARKTDKDEMPDFKGIRKEMKYLLNRAGLLK